MASPMKFIILVSIIASCQSRSSHRTTEDPCLINACSNGATCIATNETSYVCACTSLYAGCYCEHQIDPCNPDPCINGQCHADNYGYQCQCLAGWYGKNCSHIDFCQSNPCQHDGTCYPEPDGYLCVCPKEYGGCNCQYDIPTIPPRTTTVSTNSTDETYTTVTDPCASNPCEHGGTCYPTSGGNYKCKCPPVYSGDKCQVSITTVQPHTTRMVDSCNDNPCQHGGTCSSSSGGYNCTCPSNYMGINCQQAVPTTQRYTTIKDACAFSPCQNGGTCYNIGGTYKCSCPTGYSGDKCQMKKDGCDGNPCKNGGTCTSYSDGDHTCGCPMCWAGFDCGESIC